MLSPEDWSNKRQHLQHNCGEVKSNWNSARKTPLDWIVIYNIWKFGSPIKLTIPCPAVLRNCVKITKNHIRATRDCHSTDSHRQSVYCSTMYKPEHSCEVLWNSDMPWLYSEWFWHYFKRTWKILVAYPYRLMNRILPLVFNRRWEIRIPITRLTISHCVTNIVGERRGGCWWVLPSIVNHLSSWITLIWPSKRELSNLSSFWLLAGKLMQSIKTSRLKIRSAHPWLFCYLIFCTDEETEDIDFREQVPGQNCEVGKLYVSSRILVEELSVGMAWWWLLDHR